MVDHVSLIIESGNNKYDDYLKICEVNNIAPVSRNRFIDLSFDIRVFMESGNKSTLYYSLDNTAAEVNNNNPIEVKRCCGGGSVR